MAPPKQLLPRPVTLALLISLVASGGLAALLLTTDPSPRELRLFVALILVATAGLGSVLAASLGGQTGRPLLDSLRAFRRGTLIGLACAGVVVLQVNAALTPTNLAFLVLVLLIVEMIFLARRQHPA